MKSRDYLWLRKKEMNKDVIGQRQLFITSVCDVYWWVSKYARSAMAWNYLSHSIEHRVQFQAIRDEQPLSAFLTTWDENLSFICSISLEWSINHKSSEDKFVSLLTVIMDTRRYSSAFVRSLHVWLTSCTRIWTSGSRAGFHRTPSMLSLTLCCPRLFLQPQKVLRSTNVRSHLTVRIHTPESTPEQRCRKRTNAGLTDGRRRMGESSRFSSSLARRKRHRR